jgi:hypothetical protein
MKFKKIFFPFLNDLNKFLLGKWWFRLIIVLYVITFAILPFYWGLTYLDNATSWCYDSLRYYDVMSAEWDSKFEACQEIARETWLPAIGVAISGTLLIHYFIQFIFFRIIIGFIVFGGTERKSN